MPAKSSKIKKNLKHRTFKPVKRQPVQLLKSRPRGSAKKLTKRSASARLRAASANNLKFMRHTVSELKLKNGIRGLLVHVPEASVMTFDINFRAGEYLVKPDKWETPHLMEHLLL